MKRRTGSLLGMSLVEVTIVIVVLTVIMAGVFMLFVSSTEHFQFARRQNELDISGRMTLDRMTNEIIWAGYMPYGGWDNEDWHPMAYTDPDSLSFYADFDPFRSLNNTDYRNIWLEGDGHVRIADNSGKIQLVGENIFDLDYEFLDENANVIPFPHDEAARDLIRHVRIDLMLADTVGDDVYQTVLHTTISPRNLGLNHEINPAFFPPSPMDGIIVVNVRGVGEIQDPTLDEQLMINRLQWLGFTVTILTDEQLYTYDYTDVVLVLLRHLEGGSHANPAFFQSLAVPIVTLDAQDAVDLFGMGAGEIETGLTYMTCNPFYWNWHPVTYYLPDSTYYVYNMVSAGRQSILTGPAAGDTTVIFAGTENDSTYAAAVCNAYTSNADKRIHFSGYDASEYTSILGWRTFENVIFWAAAAPPSNQGDPITTLEDFEGPGVGSQEITLWQDQINPVAMPDTVPIYYEPFTGGTVLSWLFAPLGGGRVFVNMTDNCLQEDRAVAGASTRGLARLTVDLSAYSMLTDELVLSARCRSYEGAPDASDGIFFTGPGSADTLFFEGFEGMADAPGDMQFWGDLYGRYRIIPTSYGWSSTGQFVCFDTRTAGQFARNRMMAEVSTTGVPAGTQLMLSFRFHDHADESNAGASGDFVGWNSTGVIDGAVTVLQDLAPGSYDNTQWHSRSVTFTPSPLPDPIYILFGQYGSQQASTFTGNDGISIDNVMVTVPGDTLYTRFGLPNSTSAWEWVHIDLDDAAQAYSYPFSANYQIWFSQYGNAPVPNGGRQWDDVTIGRIVNVLSVPGWTHGPMPGFGATDDWNPKIIAPVMGHCWAMQQTSGAQYSNSQYAWLQSPEVAIPADIEDPALQFTHSYSTQYGNDGGYVQISVDGGAWTVMMPSSGLDYDDSSPAAYPGGAGIPLFTGTSGWKTETADLTPYKGHNVRFRFVFGADAATQNSGWFLDNFRVYGTATGYVVSSIDFEAASVPAPWNYSFDVWMASGPETSFPGSGEWNKAAMTQVVNDGNLGVNSSGWKTITLDTPFLLPPGQSLFIKIEQHDAAWSGTPITWMCDDATGVCRWGESSSGDPTWLNPHARRPNIKVNTTTGILIPDVGTFQQDEIPLNNSFIYSDVEMIYTAAELGTEGSGGVWTHGGQNDDWEIGTPLILTVDPPLTPDNGMNIAGNDLTVDGFYFADENAWLVSPAYAMPPSGMYDSVRVFYDRCVRLAGNDFASVFIAFDDDQTPPVPNSPDWMEVRTYVGENQDLWDNEMVDLTSEFQDAWTAGKAYYYIRYYLFSGFWLERGGWNLDNIQFFATPL